MNDQKAWDRALITAWRNDAPMRSVIQMFLFERYPEELNDCFIINNWMQAKVLITSLKLKRCRDRDTFGNVLFCATRGPAKEFIEMRSGQLADCLWAGTVTDDDILANIDNFKWRRINFTRKRSTAKSQKNRRFRLKGQSEKILPMRDFNDKSHDWGTVK